MDYTTSQVSGLTHLTLKTIQRYINNFPDYFGEAARKPRKGRRYRTQDVDNLLTIRRMSQHHAKKFEIEIALRGVVESPALPMVETENILHIAEGARQAMIEAEKSAQRANEILLTIEERLTRYSDSSSYVSKQNRILEARMKRYEDRLARLLEYFDEMDVIDGDKMLRKFEAEERAQAELQSREKERGGIPAEVNTTKAPHMLSLWDQFVKVVKNED
jgi:DNA-binding transcriptional MerR regulator